jgi:hypothetical protein
MGLATAFTTNRTAAAVKITVRVVEVDFMSVFSFEGV